MMTLKSTMSSVRFLLAVFLLASPCAFAQGAVPAATADSAAQIAAHSRKAQQYLREKRPDLAIPELEAVVRLDPDNLDAEANLGVLLYFRGDYADASQALHKALEIHAGIPKLQALLGMSEEHSGDGETAIRDLSAAFPQLHNEKIQVETGMSLIHLYQVNSNFAQAADIVRQLQKLEPENPELLYIAYRLYADLAAQSMLSLSLVAPDSAQMHAAIAHVDTMQGQNGAAIAELRKALAADPTLPGASYELAELLRHADDVKQQAEAASIYEAALKANPFDAPSLVALGDMDLTQGNFQQGQGYFERALKINPSSAEANFGMAKALLGENHAQQALPILEKAVRLDPTNASAHYRLAMLYRQEGREQDARKQLKIFQRLHKLKDRLSAIYKKMREPVAASNGSGEKP